MGTTYTPYTSTGQNRSFQDLFNEQNRQYLSRGGKSYENYRAVGNTGALVTGTFGTPAQKVGLTNLLQMLMTQGRVDPRLLAQAQAQNSRSTQMQQDAARGGAARGGFGNSGLAAALQAAIGSSGANRSANLNYQDIADSYARNQQNLGLLDQLVIQPQLGYASLGQQDLASSRDAKQKQLAAGVSLIGGGLGALGR